MTSIDQHFLIWLSVLWFWGVSMWSFLVALNNISSGVWDTEYDVEGSDTVGPRFEDTVVSDKSWSETIGYDTVWSDTVGTNLIGPDTVGSDTVDTVGSDAVVYDTVAFDTLFLLDKSC